jgi:hypothetical protein
MRHLF